MKKRFEDIIKIEKFKCKFSGCSEKGAGIINQKTFCKIHFNLMKKLIRNERVNVEPIKLKFDRRILLQERKRLISF